MRKRINYANVVATLALFLSMSGGALAASHYLINSTKQINPKVLKKLRSAVGKTGPQGKEGAKGAEGPKGAEGSKGKEGPAGPTAGGFVSSSTLSPALGTPAINVMTLSEGSGAVVAPGNGVLLISASGSFQKLNAAGHSDADCWISVSSGGGAFNEVSKTMIRSFSGEFENQALAVSAGTSVTAGVSYNAALTCESFNPEVKFVRGDMTAVFAG
jgi:hypothetical protein